MRGSSPKLPVHVLFVCVGNSCRSQMAEGLANHLADGRVRAWSAGSHPLGTIISQTYTVMLEKGISLEGHWSKSMKDVPVDQMDVVVGMGCEVTCPVPVGFKGWVIEWNISDPYGRDDAYFRSVRDLIERHVKALIEEVQQQAGAGGKAAETGA